MQPAVPPDTPADSSWKLITLAVLLAAGGVIYWACQPGPPFAPPLKKLSSKQREALFAGRNQVLGQLDNALSDAQINPVLQKLDELEKILPGDRFISQNRAIAYVLALQVQDKAEVPKLAPDEVLAELEAIKQADPKSAVPWLLAAQVAEKNSQGERMLAEARKAVKLAPQEPLAWFAVAKAGEFLAGEPEVARETETALGKALEFDPTNTHILRLLAVVLATQQNPEVEQVLQTLRSQTALLDLVRRDAAAQNKDPQEIDRYFDQAQQAAQEKDWDRCTGLCTRIGNLIKSQGWVQSDRQRIDPDQLALRFVATDFSTKLAPAPASDSTLSPLQFAPAEGLPPLPELPGVVDLQVADADDDGTLDLVLLTPTTLRVISPRDGNWMTLFEHTGAGPWRRVLVADLDRDENKNARKEPVAGGATPPTDPRTCDTADVDFLLWGAGGLVVLRNELQDPPPARQVLVVAQSDEFNAQRDPRDVCLVDIDHDGDLDLVVALDKTVRFWRNRGNQTFEEVTDRSQIPAGSFSIASLTAGPWNHDCFLDVVATTADGNLGVFENLGHSAFRWVPLADAAQAAPAGDRVLLFDADGNADWDLATAGPQGIGLVKSRAPEVGLVEIASAQALSTSAATQLFAADLNNDSWFDLVAWSHTAVVTPLVFAGSPAGPVAKATPLTLPGLTAIQALATADLDRDGDLDLVAAGKEGVRLFFNTTPATGHWLALRLRAQPDDKVARVNHLGIGSVVEVWMGDQVRRQIVSQQFTHFGLGEVTAPDLLRIVWTNCVPQAQLSPATDQVLCQVQVQTTSCPF
ncbi:MAG: FG-GAP-like repeat-containing protein, partial [Planctomycetaceae bacterium]